MDAHTSTKSKLRSEMRSFLAGMNTDQMNAASIAICEHIASTRWLTAKAQIIGLYASIQCEISLRALHDLLPDKRFAYPVCKANNHLGFHIVEHVDELTPGHYNIPEPLSGKHPETHLADIDLILCPGLAFGMDGSRLGRGQGYYDRTLQAYEGLKIGIALDEQIRHSVPHEHHDIKMSYLASEKGIAATTPLKE
ncbi:MAG: 5-formyltetrahydrofolate cyclo-ligase [Akkermansiaceae bacterium]